MKLTEREKFYMLEEVEVAFAVFYWIIGVKGHYLERIVENTREVYSCGPYFFDYQKSDLTTTDIKRLLKNKQNKLRIGKYFSKASRIETVFKLLKTQKPWYAEIIKRVRLLS